MRAWSWTALLIGVAVYGQGVDLTNVGTAANPGAEMVVDAIRVAAKADAAMQAAGFFTEGKLGPSVDADALNKLLAYPGEEIYVLSLTGDQVKKMMERSLSLLPQPNRAFLQVSGMTIEYSPAAPAQNRVKKIAIAGKPLSPTGTYRIAAPATLARGALGYFTIWTKDQVAGQTGITVETAVSNYLAGKRSWPLGETNRIVGE